LPIWTDFMLAATRGRSVEQFNVPRQGETREICTETGLLATDACITVTAEIFPPGTEPTEYCNVHIGLPRQPGQHDPPYDSEAPPEEPLGEPGDGRTPDAAQIPPAPTTQRPALEGMPSVPPPEKKPRTIKA
jgi:hypothetical protein